MIFCIIEYYFGTYY